MTSFWKSKLARNEKETEGIQIGKEERKLCSAAGKAVYVEKFKINKKF